MRTRICLACEFNLFSLLPHSRRARLNAGDKMALVCCILILAGRPCFQGFSVLRTGIQQQYVRLRVNSDI
jgi:hypothetical protein